MSVRGGERARGTNRGGGSHVEQRMGRESGGERRAVTSTEGQRREVEVAKPSATLREVGRDVLEFLSVGCHQRFERLVSQGTSRHTGEDKELTVTLMHSLITAEFNNLSTMSQCIFIWGGAQLCILSHVVVVVVVDFLRHGDKFYQQKRPAFPSKYAPRVSLPCARCGYWV